jgi:hypothetical protein
LFLVTDVTHMRGDKVCILGVNDQFETIRPELPPPGIFLRHLKIKNGVICPRSVLHIHFKPPHKKHPPHIEDMDWDIEADTEFLRMTSEANWRNALEKTCFGSVQDIFGTTIHSKRIITPPHGLRSVGTIRVKSFQYFRYEIVERRDGTKEAYRLGFRDESGEDYAELNITDLNFRYYFHHLLNTHSAHDASQIIETYLKKTGGYVRIGLTRPWEGRLWLQVNGIYTFPDYANGMCFMDYKQAGICLPD